MPKLIGKCPDDPITAKRATNEMINVASNFKKTSQVSNIFTAASEYRNEQSNACIYLFTHIIMFLTQSSQLSLEIHLSVNKSAYNYIDFPMHIKT